MYRQLRALNGYEFTEDEKEEARSTILDNLTLASLLVSFRIRDLAIYLDAEACKVRLASFFATPFQRPDSRSQCLPSLRSSYALSLEKNRDPLWFDALVRYVRAFRELLRNANVRNLMCAEDSAGLHDNIEL